LSETTSTPTRSRTLPHAARPVDAARVPHTLALREELSRRAFRVGLAVCSAGVAAFVLARLLAWPPHEDETLALFVGRHSLPDLLQIVLGRRGGAPLHFLLSFVVVHLGGGLGALRLLSAFFAVASVPLVGLIGARLAGRTAGLAAAALASGSWVLLFHGVYGRMYSLFLFTSALSYLGLLLALDRGTHWRWALWGLAIVATVATHPYGALVLASQGLFVLARLRGRQLRDAVLAFAAVGVVCVPFWRTDLVLAGRFDVGVAGRGAKLGGPLPVLRYLRTVAGDFSAGYTAVLVVVLALAVLGAVELARTRREGALLIGLVFGTPTAMFLAASFGSQTSPESRHLIFALPFFSTLVAVGLVRLGRLRQRAAPALAVTALVALIAIEAAWGDHKTPLLFTGEPAARVAARNAASDWLARTGRPNDVLFGYDPLYLGAWERNRVSSQPVVPRADTKLALEVLGAAKKPLGRGVWVFDASDTNNYDQKLTIPLRRPSPTSEFEARVFGPFLVIRTRAPTRTIPRYLERALAAESLGQQLFIGDADVNVATLRRAAKRYGVLPPPR
jgi:4-amino-4-deoxy-L-arabinose transferase-like glycosyltransferase